MFITVLECFYMAKACADADGAACDHGRLKAGALAITAPLGMYYRNSCMVFTRSLIYFLDRFRFVLNIFVE